jgi:CRP-like cAMP-binding protein
MRTDKSRKGQTPQGANVRATKPPPANHAPFDPDAFLAKVGDGRSIVEYRKNRVVFAQGDKADAVFYLRKGKVKLAVVSNELLLLANFGKEGKPEAVIPKISQETLAKMIGTTRSRVSFFMNKFRKLGFIYYNDGLEVHSSLLNIILHD